jgi:hypothetical protein
VVSLFVVELAAYSRPCGLLTWECFFRLPRCFLLYKTSVRFEVHASALTGYEETNASALGAGLGGKMRVTLLGHATVLVEMGPMKILMDLVL